MNLKYTNTLYVCVSDYTHQGHKSMNRKDPLQLQGRVAVAEAPNSTSASLRKEGLRRRHEQEKSMTNTGHLSLCSGLLKFHTSSCIVRLQFKQSLGHPIWDNFVLILSESVGLESPSATTEPLCKDAHYTCSAGSAGASESRHSPSFTSAVWSWQSGLRHLPKCSAVSNFFYRHYFYL